jgi:Zn-dependent protease with chaperone function
MRLRALLLLLFSFFLALIPAQAATTPTEAAATAVARQDHTAYTLPPAALIKAQHLETYRVFNHFAPELWQILSVFLILQFGIAARLRNVANNLTKNRLAQAYLFLLLFMVLAGLLSLPFDLYSQHVQLEYGLSVQGWGSWVGDLLKSFAIAYVFGGLFLWLLFAVIRKYPRTWWLPVWGLASVLVVALVYLVPIFIDPLFNKFEPLSQTNPELVQRLEQVVARGQGIHIPPERMFLMKASAKVTTLNAYVTGFGGSKRVVVWDTSIAKGTTDEVLFIFGHEMGHYVLGHILRGVAFGIVFLLVMFFLGFQLVRWLIARFGKRWRIPAQDNWAAFYVFVLVLSTLNFLTEPIQNGLSRHMEHDADVYGEEVVHGIVANPQLTGQQAFDLLGANSFDDPAPHPFLTRWTGSHPPIRFRAAFAKAYDPWAPGNEPKYFKK